MKSPVLVLSLSTATLVLSGCITLYKPNAVHSAMVNEEGELSVSANLALSGGGLINLQGAYAFSDHWAVMGNGMYHSRRSSTISGADSGVEKLDILHGELGIGFYAPFGPQRHGLFQCYGGTGYGYAHTMIHYPSGPDPLATARYVNLFLQPGIAVTGEHFELAFDVRANYVKLIDVQAYLYDHFEWWNTDFHYTSDTTLDFMNIEPALTIKAGGQLKGMLQLGLTLPTYKPDNYFMVDSYALLIFPLIKLGLGISYTLGRKAQPIR
jgi:hypothetical protein